MKRLHVHVSVDDLDGSIPFYTTLFDAEPSVRHSDYAKWMMDDPKVNFAISARGREAGIEHLGIQVDTAEELGVLAGRLKRAGAITRDEAAATCCYAQADKSWVEDPSGVRWETFFTFGQATHYGEDYVASKAAQICCTSATPQGVCCPPKAELASDAPCCGEAA